VPRSPSGNADSACLVAVVGWLPILLHVIISACSGQVCVYHVQYLMVPYQYSDLICFFLKLVNQVK
jgi:hypothetical protein